MQSRRALLQRDVFDGVDSDDETESDEDKMPKRANARDGETSDSEEDLPQVVGDVEIDMKEEEEEFLRFSRDVLGISEDMWANIVKDRHGRGGMTQGPKYSE